MTQMLKQGHSRLFSAGEALRPFTPPHYLSSYPLNCPPSLPPSLSWESCVLPRRKCPHRETQKVKQHLPWPHLHFVSIPTERSMGSAPLFRPRYNSVSIVFKVNRIIILFVCMGFCLHTSHSTCVHEMGPLQGHRSLATTVTYGLSHCAGAGSQT